MFNCNFFNLIKNLVCLGPLWLHYHFLLYLPVLSLSLCLLSFPPFPSLCLPLSFSFPLSDSAPLSLSPVSSSSHSLSFSLSSFICCPPLFPVNRSLYVQRLFAKKYKKVHILGRPVPLSFPILFSSYLHWSYLTPGLDLIDKDYLKVRKVRRKSSRKYLMPRLLMPTVLCYTRKTDKKKTRAQQDVRANLIYLLELEFLSSWPANLFCLQKHQ